LWSPGVAGELTALPNPLAGLRGETRRKGIGRECKEWKGRGGERGKGKRNGSLKWKGKGGRIKKLQERGEKGGKSLNRPTAKSCIRCCSELP